MFHKTEENYSSTTNNSVQAFLRPIQNYKNKRPGKTRYSTFLNLSLTLKKRSGTSNNVTVSLKIIKIQQKIVLAKRCRVSKYAIYVLFFLVIKKNKNKNP